MCEGELPGVLWPADIVGEVALGHLVPGKASLDHPRPIVCAAIHSRHEINWIS